MASRKSSILKPRKAREPLQDLNQLLPNDDEETTTEVQKRRVSFASMNKVKEFEVAAECVTLLNTQGYEERVNSSCSPFPSVGIAVRKESIHPVISNENACPSHQFIAANVIANDDIELTETVNRIYDTPMKSSGDSSMEITHPVGCLTQRESFELSRSTLHITSNEFVDKSTVEMDLTNKTNIADNNDSSMETTEVISNAIIKNESLVSHSITGTETSLMKLTPGLTYDVLIETVQSQSILYENCADQDLTEQIEYVSMRDVEPAAPPRKSIFEMSRRPSTVANQWQSTDDISLTSAHDASASEYKHTNVRESKTMQLNEVCDQDASINSSIQDVSMRDAETVAPPRKSIFEMSGRQSTVANQWQVGRKSIGGPLSDTILLTNILDTSDNENDIIDGTNLHESKITHNDEDSRIRVPERHAAKKSIFEMNRRESAVTNERQTGRKSMGCPQADAILMTSMFDASANGNEIIDGKINESRRTRFDKADGEESSMQVLSQPQACSTKLPSQFENKTKLHSSSAQLLSQESVDDGIEPVVGNRTRYSNSSMHLISHENANKTEYDNASMQLMSQDATNKTNYNVSSMQLATQETKDDDDNEFKNVGTNEREPEADVVAEKVETVENALEISQKSSADTSNSNDSSSPLQLDVNFSIYIDPKKKKPNLEVNIVKNKSKQQKRDVSKWRFSMPAMTKNALPDETACRPEFWATFTSDNVPRDDEPSEKAQSAPEKEQEAAKERPSLALDGEKAEDMSKFQLSKPAQKRLSSDAFEEQIAEDEVAAKRRSLGDCQDSEPAVVDKSETIASEQQQHVVVTEIVQERRESIVRECKSVVTVDDVTMETQHAKSGANSNVSFQSRQITTVSSSEESRTVTSLSSISHIKMKDRSPEIRSETGSVDHSFSTFNRSSPSERRRTRGSVNRSALHEDDGSDYSLHNPSIIVNVGDSFSHYKSMDLGVDEQNDALASDAVGEIERENLIDNIESESISKENFVTDWLQNKMSKVSAAEKANLTAASSGMSNNEASKVTTVAPQSADESKEEDEGAALVDSTNEPKDAETSTEPSNVVVAEIAPKGCSIEDNDPNDQLPPAQVSLNESGHSRHDVEEGESPKEIRENARAVETNIENIQLAAENGSAFCEYRVATDERPSTPNRESDVESSPVASPTPITADPRVANESEQINVVMKRISLDDAQAEKTLVDEAPVDMEVDDDEENERQSMAAHEISVEEKYEQIRSSLAGCEKRRKVSPECERIVGVGKSSYARISSPLSQPSTRSEAGDFTLFFDPKCDANKRASDGKTTKNKKREVLEKIDRECDANTEWKLKTTTDEEWIFEFLFGHLVLSIRFCEDNSKSACTASMHFVAVSKKKAVELLKIAVNSVIRKYECSSVSLCRTVEDVPYLLKLIVPDVLYAKNFVIAMLKLEDSEYVKIKNDIAQFYVSSYKKHVLFKIMVNIKYLEKAGVNDVEVRDIVGKADVNLIRSIFSEAGRDYDFFTKFVRRLWHVLDPKEPK